jgi:hypothetical protein
MWPLPGTLARIAISLERVWTASVVRFDSLLLAVNTVVRSSLIVDPFQHGCRTPTGFKKMALGKRKEGSLAAQKRRINRVQATGLEFF